MTLRTLIHRSLRFHWRSNLGVVIGAAIGSAALVGALVVGDSVKGSLREQALARLGAADAALLAGDRLVTEDLAERMFRTAPLDSGADYAPVLILPGTAIGLETGLRANSIQLIGVDGRFTAFGGEAWRRAWEPDAACVNEALAAQLGIEVGQTVIVRAHKPTALSKEAPVSPGASDSLTLRLRVVAVIPGRSLGGFALRASGQPALNLFVNLRSLETAADAAGRVNALLAKDGSTEARPDAAETHSVRLRKAWRFADTQCTLTQATDGTLEVRSDRIFLEPAVERATRGVDTNARPLLTYIANLITSGTNATPYSMVTAAGPPWTPSDLAEDEIVVNQWLADDLQAGPGDRVTLVYYDPESGARLTERTNTFRVHSVVPLQLPWADRTLMPDFPGVEKAERTADWDTAFPLTYTIRPQDDDYWRDHRGTPKAFISLAAGKRMWANRFGEVTAVRFPLPPADSMRGDLRPADRDAYRSYLERRILAQIDPGELGLRFEPVREQALRAATESQDFGGLFIGFSLFLIASALILMALLFQFGLEQRATEVGTLLALGFRPGRVRCLLLGEGVVLAFIGGVMGTGGGVFYARLMLLGLATVWSDAVGGTTLRFFITPGSLAIGLVSSASVAALTLWLALRKQVRRPAMVLLALNSGLRTPDRRLRTDETGGITRLRRLIRACTNAALIGTASLIAAASLAAWALATGETANAGAFFGAGALVLVGGLTLVTWGLRWMTRERALPGPEAPPMPTPAGLAVRAAARRRSRSVATAALLASGSFLILSIGVFRLDATRDATQPGAGTGGFALIGEAAIPVVQDLNSTAGREFFALPDRDMDGVRFVPFRVRAGDEASCLNLNRAQQPRLLGVRPEALGGRFTFAKGEGWKALKSGVQPAGSEQGEAPRAGSETEIAAIGDLNSILWAMGRKVGDTIDYVDDRGSPFKVRIVGAVANSILQGNLVIDEAAFVKRFPDASGYQYFLIDAPTNRQADLTGTLSRALQDYGLELTPTTRRLNQFNAVQNTYLGTFQILGGLGLLLGSAGLGVVVLRNVLERRGELAVLVAVGFRKRTIGRLVLAEHAALLGCGLAIGLLAAAVAVLPSLISPGSELPYASLAPTMLAVLANGLIWTWAAARAALRGNLLDALRND